MEVSQKIKEIAMKIAAQKRKGRKKGVKRGKNR
jgi:hypothetical protein